MQKATRQQTKDHNTRLVLRTIYDAGDISRAAIARATGLTRPTVSAIVADLLESDLVTEIGPGPSVGGKRPTLVKMKDNGRQLLALDLSGTEFHGALLNLNGEIIGRVACQIDGAQGEAALEAVSQIAESLLYRATSPLLGIGVATPGLVDPERGIVLRAVNLDWENLPLRDRFEARFGHPVYVANDSHIAALAEYSYGPERAQANLIVIRIGRGIGAGIVLNGAPFYGDDFGAGEVGHVVVAENGALCSCGNHGCLETTSSTRAMLQQMAVVTTRQAVDWDSFAAAARDGDRAATEIVAAAGRHLGVAVAHLVGGFNVRHIVLAGRVADLGKPFLAAVESEMCRRVLPSMAETVRLSYSPLGRDILTLGCSAHILHRELGIV